MLWQPASAVPAKHGRGKIFALAIRTDHRPPIVLKVELRLQVVVKLIVDLDAAPLCIGDYEA